jgi:hypothetical protein
MILFLYEKKEDVRKRREREREREREEKKRLEE